MPAADNLAALVEPLEKIITEEGLTVLPGVGEAIADIITKLHRTGTYAVFKTPAVAKSMG
jgi:DNA polymerase (family 10)